MVIAFSWHLMATQPERETEPCTFLFLSFIHSFIHSFNSAGIILGFRDRALKKTVTVHMELTSTYKDNEFPSLVAVITLCFSYHLWQRTPPFLLSTSLEFLISTWPWLSLSRDTWPNTVWIDRIYRPSLEPPAEPVCCWKKMSPRIISLVVGGVSDCSTAIGMFTCDFCVYFLADHWQTVHALALVHRPHSEWRTTKK